MPESSQSQAADQPMEPTGSLRAADARPNESPPPSSLTTEPPQVAVEHNAATILSGSSAHRRQAATGLEPNSVAALPALGDRLDAFVIEEAIGAGGMGAVFRAETRDSIDSSP